MYKRCRLFVNLLATMLMLVVTSTNAVAAEWILHYDPNGIIDLRLDKSRGRNRLLVSGLPVTGDRFSGTCILKLDGVPIERVEGAPYHWTINLDGDTIPALKEVKDIPKDKFKDIVLNEDWFLRAHVVEMYFTTVDGKGRSDKNKSAAPTLQFRLNKREEGSAVASQGQLDDAARLAFEQGRDEAQKAWNSEREQLMSKINELSDRLAHVEVAKIEPTLKPIRFTAEWATTATAVVGSKWVIHEGSRYIGEARMVAYDKSARRASFDGRIPEGLTPDWKRWKITLLAKFSSTGGGK